MNTPEGWITRLAEGPHKHLVVVPEEGKEPTIKYFDTKDIFLSNEQQKYEAEVLKKGHNILWLGSTGWTKPPKHYPERYGATEEKGIYETLVTTIQVETILSLKKNGIETDLRHGTSDAGVDAATMKTMELLPVSGSGVICPMYMPWVSDDKRGGPTLVAESKLAYHELYSKYHHILLVTGGRDVAFHHDYLKRLMGTGYSVVCDVMQTVSKEIIPGTEIMPGNDKPQLNNAAAYIREKNSFTYSPVPRTFEELSAQIRLSVLDCAYKVLQISPDKEALLQLEEEMLFHRKNTKPHTITRDELEYRINQARSEYLNLANHNIFPLNGAASR